MSSRTWLRRATVTALAAAVVPLGALPAAAASGSSGAAAGAADASPRHVVAALAADTSTPTPSSSTVRPVTKGEQGDLSFGYVLFGVILALFVALGAWFLRTRRGRPQ